MGNTNGVSLAQSLDDDPDMYKAKHIIICCDGTWCGEAMRTTSNTKILSNSFAGQLTTTCNRTSYEPLKPPLLPSGVYNKCTGATPPASRLRGIRMRGHEAAHGLLATPCTLAPHSPGHACA